MIQARPVQPRKATPLEAANEIYRMAFLIKRTRFATEHPDLPAAEIDRLTARYFSSLPNSKA